MIHNVLKNRYQWTDLSTDPLVPSWPKISWIFKTILITRFLYHFLKYILKNNEYKIPQIWVPKIRRIIKFQRLQSFDKNCFIWIKLRSHTIASYFAIISLTFGKKLKRFLWFLICSAIYRWASDLLVIDWIILRAMVRIHQKDLLLIIFGHVFFYFFLLFFFSIFRFIKDRSHIT
jgi:hypothetical protein